MAKIISLNEVTPGMVAAQDIMTNDGHVLLAGGTILTEKHIALLQKREVDSLPIREPEEKPAAIDEELVKIEANRESAVIRLAQAHLKEVFARVRGDKLMEKLLALALKRAKNIRLTPGRTRDA